MEVSKIASNSGRYACGEKLPVQIVYEAGQASELSRTKQSSQSTARVVTGLRVSSKERLRGMYKHTGFPWSKL